ncbi:DUF4097 family beta strand repeat-containing protein [Gulosibacter chungangensis]|uniref:DUF4097 domain-containing protein n=1 Tax=Gulosibacter chungangensis TaxID=979746 RepID=A0A7J5B953_9MICO|nr:hypothetical protein [Gulosibacter chungangensis]KAB1641944.1 hypothetical protein F8O05_11540 [Gulosibacter chungangensis]
MNATEQYDTLPYEPLGQEGENPGGNMPTPPAEPSHSDGEAPKPERRHAWVGILATVVGSILLISLFGWTVVTGIWQGSIKSVDAQTSVAAAESLRVDVSYGNVEINFSDATEEANLEVTGFSRGGEVPMTLTNTGSEVVLQARNDGSWFNGGPNWWQDRELEGVLTLPSELEGNIDVNIELGVGEVTINGELRDIHAEVGTGILYVNNTFNTGEFSSGVGSIVLSEGGGNATIDAGTGDVLATGAFESLTAEVGIGSFTFEGNVTDRADFTFDMGDGHIHFVESMPRETRIETNIGNVELDIPQVPIALDAPLNVVAAAEDAGYQVDGGADAPQVLILVDMRNVTFY